MNEEEKAIYRFYREFDAIPTELVERAIDIDREEIKILAPTFEQWKASMSQDELSYYEDEDEQLECYELENPEIPMLATYFFPIDPTDRKWIENNLEKVANCGFIVYDIPMVGLCLGINGYGYSHLDEEWKNLYRARGLQWHKY